MSYLVSVTFDIKDGTADDYTAIYSGLAKLGLSTHVTSDIGNRIQLPTTTCVGTFTGGSAAAARDDLTTRIEQLFVTNGLTGEIFVTVGGDWAWGYRHPQAKKIPSWNQFSPRRIGWQLH